MKLSHSRIECHTKCQRQFRYRYIDKLGTLPTDDPTNPLILGHALHTGIEKGVAEAIHEYYWSYPIINDNHITEAMKLSVLIPRVKAVLPPGEHEVKIENDDFIGFIDLLAPVSNYEVLDYDLNSNYKWFDLYDFKYSNNVDSYMESGQLSEYKYFFEKLNPDMKIRNLYFVFIPKCNFRMKYANKTNPRDETIYEFRQRSLAYLEEKEILIKEVKYQPEKVIEFLTNSKHAIEDTTYEKNESRLCDWCEFKKYCLEGIDYEIVERRR